MADLRTCHASRDPSRCFDQIHSHGRIPNQSANAICELFTGPVSVGTPIPLTLPLSQANWRPDLPPQPDSVADLEIGRPKCFDDRHRSGLNSFRVRHRPCRFIAGAARVSRAGRGVSHAGAVASRGQGLIRLAVMMYVRYPLSLRQVADLLFERGIDICHETVRFWWNRFGPMFAAEIRKRRVHHRSFSNLTCPHD